MQEGLQRLRCQSLKRLPTSGCKPPCLKARRLSHKPRQRMQCRARGHPPLCASTLPAGMAAKDPAASSPLRCEAARMLLMPVLSKAGPGGAAAASSQSQRALLCHGSGAARSLRARLQVRSNEGRAARAPRGVAPAPRANGGGSAAVEGRAEWRGQQGKSSRPLGARVRGTEPDRRHR